ncbi:S-layer homology domain-containing protein [Bacillus benzoevorans]|uniref:SLH domain-containing protein n=1 Tax=Bacillus benzoevorans TaxID=1456 RepID=A0A7X0HSL9_9BACI|nr:S-layer homology domain-containing protein [Bacillus benzoevorans]MBB6446073.1 hypothetical protein [Bacillus benzoevorans]
MPHQPNLHRKYAAGAVSAALVGLSFTATVNASGFLDLDGNAHKEAILALADQGIIAGYSDGTFRPFNRITRGDAAVIVARTLGLLDGKNIPSTTFTDLHTVNASTQEAIAKLAGRGIVSGFTSESFRPLDTITRAQMAKYIVAAFGLPLTDAETDFPDVNPNSGLAVYVAALANAGITVGKNDGTFGFHDPLFRGDFAAMIYRALTMDSPGTQPITIKGDDRGNNLRNGEAKTFTVTLINPVSNKPIEGAELNVTFAENVGTDFSAKRNVIVTNGYGNSNIPYQSDDGQKAEVKIKTDKNGKAVFTITGSNATVTPIVFLDGSNQTWDTKGGIIIKTQDGRFDEKYEFHAKAEPVTFSTTPYNISITGQRTNYAAIAETDENGNIIEHNGREYKIYVTKPDGTAFAGGTVNVGIYQLLDGVLGNEPTGSYFPEFIDENGRYLKQGQVKLDAKGEAVITLASTDVNDSAEPIVWIDQNYANNAQPGTLENGEPMSDQTKVEPTNFQPSRIDNGSLGAKLTVIEDDSNAVKKFNMLLLNQSGKPFMPGKEVKAKVTFEVVNTGTHRIEINTSLFHNLQLKNAVDATKESDTVAIEVGGRVTISGETLSNTITLSANAVDGVSSVKVTGSAVLDANVGNESNSVYVYTNDVEVNLPYHYDAEVTAIKVDTNGNGKPDQIELTFTKEVYNIEPGDFRIGIVPASQSTKYGKKLILKFNEEALAGDTVLKYDPYYSGAEVLTDEFGNKVLPFTFVFPIQPEEVEEPAEEPIAEPEGNSPNPATEVSALVSDENKMDEPAVAPSVQQSETESDVPEEIPIEVQLSNETNSSELQESNNLVNIEIGLNEQSSETLN